MIVTDKFVFVHLPTVRRYICLRGYQEILSLGSRNRLSFAASSSAPRATPTSLSLVEFETLGNSIRPGTTINILTSDIRHYSVGSQRESEARFCPDDSKRVEPRRERRQARSFDPGVA